MAEHFQKIPKKYWSPNSPFGDTCVFSAYEATSFVHKNKARFMPLPEAMAALTENMEPKRWRAQWLVDKFTSMGMPKRLAADGLVLMFLPGFVNSIKNVAMEDSMTKMEDASFDAMIDMERGGRGRKGMAFWTSRPVLMSKTPGAPTLKMRQMQIRFKP